MGEELQLALLGNAEVRRAGVPVTFSSSKALALLCYLAVTGRPHARPALAGLLWGDSPEANARTNLRKALTHLRRLVGPHLSITRQAVAFNREPPYWLDVERFEAKVRGASPETDIERLQAAVELYGGDFLEGFYVRQALAFEEWALAERSRLRELALDALHTLAVHHTQRGEIGHAAAIDYTTRLLALEPWREEAHRALMRLLARSGQRGAALAQYQTCRQVLADELGVEPGPETTALYERICADELKVLRPESPPPVLPPFLSATPPPVPAGQDVRQPVASAPFVARERELAQLEGFLDVALAGKGRAVFVTGEAGTGKTVLVGEFARRAQERHADLVVAGGNCNAFAGVGDPYLPFRDILGLLTGEVEARWSAGAIDQENTCRLWRLIPHSVQALLDAGPDLVDTLILGRPLLTRAAQAAPDNPGWLTQLQELVAQRKAGRGRAGLKQRDLLEQYSQVLGALAQERPLLLVIDDLQWVDVGSNNLLFHLGRRLKGSRILMVGLYRPADVAMGRDGKRHPLEPVVNEFQRHFGQIQVDLRQTEDRHFVEALLDTEPNQLSSLFCEALYQHTQGHALFTAEMLRGLQERGDLVQDECGRWIEGSPLDWQALPARVDGIIGDRIGRLPAGLQAALKVASVEGEVFTAEVVAQVQAVDEPDMVAHLSGELDKRHRLVRGQGSQRLGLGGQRLSQYRFRHILFQRYLYNDLDEAERAYLHEAVGNGLERLYAEHTDEVAVQLARHFQMAGITDKAIDYLHQAGERAARLSAHEEAITHFTQALALLETLPDSAERAKQELDLQIALGNALIATKGHMAPEVGKTYTRARELCQHPYVGETPRLFPVLDGLYRYYLVRGELQTTIELGEQFLRLAHRQSDPSLLVPAHRMLETSLWFEGDFVAAQEHLDQVIAFYKPQQHHSYVLYGQDPGVTCLCFAACVLWHLGYPDLALRRSQEALTLARELSHLESLAAALALTAQLHLFRREARATQEQAEAAIALSTEQGFALWLVMGNFFRGWALVDQGQSEEGIAQMRQGVAAFQAAGGGLGLTHWLALLAEAYGKVGLVTEGLSALTEALAAAHTMGEHRMEAEIYRFKGELLRAERAERANRVQCETEIEHCFRQAIHVARQQKAKSLELRATMSLCRLWHSLGSQHKVAEARHTLAEIYGWFTEGFDTADLKEAKALLEALA
jgi:DNA-binding SARP family transcriptional activator/predicted ATPase